MNRPQIRPSMMTSDETKIQTFADWPMSHAKRVAKDNSKVKSRISCRRRDKETADSLLNHCLFVEISIRRGLNLAVVSGKLDLFSTERRL